MWIWAIFYTFIDIFVDEKGQLSSEKCGQEAEKRLRDFNQIFFCFFLTSPFLRQHLWRLLCNFNKNIIF